MADISKCFGKGCKLRELCYRYTAKADLYQSYTLADESLTPDQTHCDMFWPDQYAIEREENDSKRVDAKRKRSKTVVSKGRTRNAK